MKERKILRQTSAFMVSVYSWMGIALLVTGSVAAFVATMPALIAFVAGSWYVFLGLLLAEVILVGYIASTIETAPFETSFFLFFVYAAFSGMTFSVIFLAYTATSIATTFFVTAGTFGLMALYGYTTKTDLSSWGNILFMGLIGLILANVVNIFVGSETADYIISSIGILVFVGFTAYDTQKIKQLSNGDDRMALIGALTLYLDFVNLFLHLLRFVGVKKD